CAGFAKPCQVARHRLRLCRLRPGRLVGRRGCRGDLDADGNSLRSRNGAVTFSDAQGAVRLNVPQRPRRRPTMKLTTLLAGTALAVLFAMPAGAVQINKCWPHSVSERMDHVQCEPN